MFDGNYQADVLLLAVQFGPRTLSLGVKSVSESWRARRKLPTVRGSADHVSTCFSCSKCDIISSDDGQPESSGRGGIVFALSDGTLFPSLLFLKA